MHASHYTHAHTHGIRNPCKGSAPYIKHARAELARADHAPCIKHARAELALSMPAACAIPQGTLLGCVGYGLAALALKSPPEGKAGKVRACMPAHTCMYAPSLNT